MGFTPILRILSDGNFHSGQSLGEQLGVSRTAIWKQINGLKDLGLDCYSVKGKGYQLPGGMELLEEDRMRAPLNESGVNNRIREIIIHESVDSTNNYLMARRSPEDVHCVACFAETQTGGKGRRGRTWVSPFGKNLYLSFGYRFEQGAASLEGLSLSVGLAVVRALNSIEIEGVSLKWPNDVLFEGKKLGGILIELQGEADGFCTVIAGVGVNIRMGVEESEIIGQPYTDLLSVAGRPVLRNLLAARVMENMLLAIEDFERSGFESVREEWQSLHAFQEKEVVITGGREEIYGKVVGVDQRGALVLDTDNGEVTINAGEVSLREAINRL